MNLVLDPIILNLDYSIKYNIMPLFLNKGTH